VEIVRPPRGVCPAARFDASGVMLNPEEAIGEIVSRGAAARFEGYDKNPAASQDRLRDGDFWTGDLGYRDENGYYWFAGRTADWLRVDSENFAAAPVERILSRFPGVTAAAVYPVPDPVTRGPGHGGARVLRWRLRPSRSDPSSARLVRLTSNLPMTATHKVSKPTLRRWLWNGEDPVYERTGERYLLMTADRKSALEAEYARHGRGHLLRL
jgi:steroid-22-oyl-CoA synthetase